MYPARVTVIDGIYRGKLLSNRLASEHDRAPRRGGIARVSRNTLCREVQGEAVLLQLESGEYFGLDAVGTRLWQLIVEKGDLAAVEDAMAAEYDVDRAVLARDVDHLVSELLAKGLIELEQPPADRG